MIGLPACQEYSRQELIQPGTRAAERETDETDEPKDAKRDDDDDERDDNPPPIVEERLHVCIDTLQCLQRLARLAQQPNNIPQLSSPIRFARMAHQFARAVEGHLKAVILVLPVTATNLRAPEEQEERV